MAVASRSDRRLQPAGAGAHHHHALGFRDDAHRAHALGLAARAGVLDAPEPPVQTHPADALLVAAEAQTDLVGGACSCLGCEVGVGDLAAHHAHQVAVALGQRSFGLQRVLEPTDTDDGEVDRLAECTRYEHRIARRDVHACLDHEQARRCHADRGVDVVDLARGLDDPGDLDRIVDRGAALDQFVATDAYAEREPVADHVTHGGDDLGEQSGAVLHRPAVLVGAPVGGGGQESAHDRRVAALQLDAVEATLGTVLGHERVAGDDLVDLGAVDRLRYLAEQRVGHGRWRPHRQAREHRGRLSAVVVDLSEDRCAMSVHGVGDPPVAGDHVAVEAVDQLLVRPVGGMGRVLLGDDQPGSAGGAGRVVRRVLFGGLAVTCVVREVGAEDDAVAGSDRPQLEGGPQIPVRHASDRIGAT